MQKKLTVLFTFAIFVLLVGWAVTPAQAHCVPEHEAKHKNCPDGGGGDDGGGGPIPVTVTFRDLFCTVVNDAGDCEDRIQSDGKGPYIDKKDKVVALIRSTAGQGKGNFVMHLSKFAIRKLFLDFSDCASGSEDDCDPPFEADFTVGAASIFTSGIDLTKMTEDQSLSELSMSVQLNLNNIEDGGTWGLFFGPNDENCLGSSRIGVTRIGLNDTWVIEAGGVHGSVGCLGKGVGGGESDSKGLYNMPFEITVQKK